MAIPLDRAESLKRPYVHSYYKNFVRRTDVVVRVSREKDHINKKIKQLEDLKNDLQTGALDFMAPITNFKKFSDLVIKNWDPFVAVANKALNRLAYSGIIRKTILGFDDPKGSIKAHEILLESGMRIKTDEVKDIMSNTLFQKIEGLINQKAQSGFKDILVSDLTDMLIGLPQQGTTGDSFWIQLDTKKNSFRTAAAGALQNKNFAESFDLKIEDIENLKNSVKRGIISDRSLKKVLEEVVLLSAKNKNVEVESKEAHNLIFKEFEKTFRSEWGAHHFMTPGKLPSEDAVSEYLKEVEKSFEKVLKKYYKNPSAAIGALQEELFVAVRIPKNLEIITSLGVKPTSLGVKLKKERFGVGQLGDKSGYTSMGENYLNLTKDIQAQIKEKPRHPLYQQFWADFYLCKYGENGEIIDRILVQSKNYLTDHVRYLETKANTIRSEMTLLSGGKRIIPFLEDLVNNRGGVVVDHLDLPALGYLIANEIWFSQVGDKDGTKYPRNTTHIMRELSAALANFLGILYTEDADDGLQVLKEGSNYFMMVNGEVLVPTWYIVEGFIKLFKTEMSEMQDRIDVRFDTSKLQYKWDSPKEFFNSKMTALAKDRDLADSNNQKMYPTALFTVGQDQGASIMESLKFDSITYNVDLDALYKSAFSFVTKP